MNTIGTLCRSFLAAPLSSTLGIGALSGLMAGSISFACLTKPLDSKPVILFLSTALISVIPPIASGHYLASLIAIPCSITTMISTVVLSIPEKESIGFRHLLKPTLLATAVVAAIAKFILGCSPLNTIALTSIFKAFLDIAISVYIYLDGLRVEI